MSHSARRVSRDNGVIGPGMSLSFFWQAEDGIRDLTVTGVQTCALPICGAEASVSSGAIADAGYHWQYRLVDSFGNATAWTSLDRKSTRLNSSHSQISYAVFCLQKKKKSRHTRTRDRSRPPPPQRSALLP